MKKELKTTFVVLIGMFFITLMASFTTFKEELNYNQNSTETIKITLVATPEDGFAQKSGEFVLSLKNLSDKSTTCTIICVNKYNINDIGLDYQFAKLQEGSDSHALNVSLSPQESKEVKLMLYKRENVNRNEVLAVEFQAIDSMQSPISNKVRIETIFSDEKDFR